MPLLNAPKRTLSEENKADTCSNPKRSKLESNREIDESTMTEPQKKANFSALSGNGISRHSSPHANSKPGASKKLVIKNFKGGNVEFIASPCVII